MAILSISLFMFFVLVFIFQQSSYGFIEGVEINNFSNLDIDMSSDSIMIDLPRQENLAKRYSWNNRVEKIQQHIQKFNID